MYLYFQKRQKHTIKHSDVKQNMYLIIQQNSNSTDSPSKMLYNQIKESK